MQLFIAERLPGGVASSFEYYTKLKSVARRQSPRRLGPAWTSGADLQVVKGERSPGIAGTLRLRVNLSEST